MFFAQLNRAIVATILLGTIFTGVGLLAYSEAGQNRSKNTGAQVPEPAKAQAPKPTRKPMPEVLQEVAKAVQSCQDPSTRAYTLAQLSKAQARAGDQQGAFESSRQATAAALQLDPEKQCSALTTIARAREEAGDRKKTLDILRLALKSTEAMKTYDWQLIVRVRLIAYAQFDLGDRDAALATIQRMQNLASAINQPGLNRNSAFSEVVSAP